MSAGASPVGQFFTLPEWARELISRGAFARWLEGARVLDPTGGDGALLEAFVSKALGYGIEPTAGMLARLHMMELDGSLVERFHARMRERYGVEVPAENTRIGDYLLEGSPGRFEVLVGNPPWMNFTELPERYKERLKPLFERYRLVIDRRRLLWGGARIDLAALVVAKAFADNALAPAEGGGETAEKRERGAAAALPRETAVAPRPGTLGAFFLPISLFFNEGAHDGFRALAAGSGGFEVERIRELTGAGVFAGVRTRYAMVDFSASGRLPRRRRPTHDRAGVEPPPVEVPAVEPIPIDKGSRPRQGVNTCGANDLFMFDVDDAPPVEPELLYPLIGAEHFEAAPGELTAPVTPRREASARRVVLLPYDRRTGRPLDEPTLRYSCPKAWAYLCSNYERLCGRRGTVIRGAIRRGHWWALLGVGPYSFARWKIVWRGTGGRRFLPRLFEGRWVPNQALQISMSFESHADAKRVLDRLISGDVERVLLAGGEAGTRGWAQPGRMRRFFRFSDA